MRARARSRGRRRASGIHQRLPHLPHGRRGWRLHDDLARPAARPTRTALATARSAAALAAAARAGVAWAGGAEPPAARPVAAQASAARAGAATRRRTEAAHAHVTRGQRVGADATEIMSTSTAARRVRPKARKPPLELPPPAMHCFCCDSRARAWRTSAADGNRTHPSRREHAHRMACCDAAAQHALASSLTIALSMSRSVSPISRKKACKASSPSRRSHRRFRLRATLHISMSSPRYAEPWPTTIPSLGTAAAANLSSRPR